MDLFFVCPGPGQFFLASVFRDSLSVRAVGPVVADVPLPVCLLASGVPRRTAGNAEVMNRLARGVVRAAHRRDIDKLPTTSES